MRERSHVRRGMAEAGPPTGRRRAALARLLTGAAGALALTLTGLAPTAQAADYVYEKVSPAYKGNGEVSGGNLIMGFRSDPTGDRVIYGSDGLFAGVPFTTGFNAYFAARHDDGWETRSPAATLPYKLPADFFVNPLIPGKVTPPGVSVDGTRAIVESNIDPATGDLVYSRMYMFDLRDYSYERLSPDPLAGDQLATVSSDGGAVGTDDFGIVYFSSTAQLVPEALAPGVGASLEKLYRYDENGLSLVSYSPAGAPSTGVPAALRDTPVGRNAVSPDGDVVWYYLTRSGTSVPLHRVEAGQDASTVVNASESSSPPAPGRAVFAGASPDGQRAVFTSQQVLVEGGPATNNVYRYTHSANPATDENLELISADGEPADGGSVVVDQVAGVSDDTDTVYFTTTSNQLVPGAPTGPGYKLYRWHDGELSYIAPARIFGSDAERLSAATSADGRYLMFVSPSAGITPDDNAGLAQQYLYDAQTGEIVCTSCLAGGSTAAVNTGVSLNVLTLGSAPRRWLLDDGRVFFQTEERLVPEDTNGKRDIYTWKDGDLELISSGRSTDDSRFADESADGSTVFFATRERLSGWDTDNAVDLYAARVGGGLPEPAARPQEACVGDDCQGPPAAPPALPPVASGVLAGGAAAGAGCNAARTRVVALRRKSGKLERRGRALRRSAVRLRRAGDLRQAAFRRRAVKRVRRRAARVDRRLTVAQRQLRVCRRGS